MNGPSSERGLRPITMQSADDDTEGGPALTVPRVVRLLAGVAVLLTIVALLARWLRPELERIGGQFVERFGLWGMALGTFIADGFHFPVPPQFYMLLSIASNTSPVATLSAITVASLAGGTAGYLVARKASRLEFVARWIERSSKLVARYGSTHGYRLVVLLSLTPIAFSALCYLAGVYRFPKRLFAVLAFLRIPKLIAYYYLVKIGWTFG